MNQVLSQITVSQASNEEVDNKLKNVFSTHLNAGQANTKLTKDGSLFASALNNLLGFNGQLQEKDSNNEIKSNEEKAVQSSTHYTISGHPVMNHSLKEMGSGHNLSDDATTELLTKNQKSDHNKTLDVANEDHGKGNTSSPGKTFSAAVANAGEGRLQQTIKTGKTTISLKDFNLQPLTLSKDNGQNSEIKSNSTTFTSGKPVSKQVEQSSALGVKIPRKPVNLNSADKNTIQKLIPHKHDVSEDDLATLKKSILQKDAGTLEKLKDSAQKSSVNSGIQTKSNGNMNRLATNLDSEKKSKPIIGNAEKTVTVQEKAEKILKNGGDQNEAFSASKRSASTILKSNNSTSSLKNNQFTPGNYMESQKNIELKINSLNTFNIDNTDNKQFDFNFDGGTGTEQLGTDSKWTTSQEIKLNSTLHQINSTAGRREMSVQIAQNIKRGWSSQSQNSEQWQNHRFVFDDGNSLNVSVKHADGGLHLQLGTGSSDLNRLIQQNLNEIHRHLQEQLNVKIDLEMQNFGSEQSDQSTSERKGKVGNMGRSEVALESTTAKGVHKRTRYLGFNQKEWTA